MLSELRLDLMVEELVNGLEAFGCREFAVEFVHPLLGSFVLVGISYKHIDDGVDLAEFFAVRFLCVRSGNGVWQRDISLLLKVPDTIHLVIAFVLFSANEFREGVAAFYFCHIFYELYIYTMYIYSISMCMQKMA